MRFLRYLTGQWPRFFGRHGYSLFSVEWLCGLIERIVVGLGRAFYSTENNFRRSERT
jgi:hypothetical protein